MKWTARLPAALLVGSLLMGSIGQFLFIRNALQAADARTARLLSQTLTHLLERAHHLKDDLALQQTVQGLSQSSNVLFACVLDNESKVIAHTNPSELGKPCTITAHITLNQMVGLYPLREEAASWGTLAIGLSRRASRQKQVQSMWLLLAGNSLAVGSLVLFWRRLKNLRTAYRQELDAVGFQHQEAVRELERLQKSTRTSDAMWSAWMQEGLEEVAHPLLLLDARQRLAACNPQACARMGIVASDSYLGRSWQDLPGVSSRGEALQKSLENPGLPVHARCEGQEIRFRTSASLGSTWILWI